MIYTDINNHMNLKYTHEEPAHETPRVSRSYKVIRFFIVVILLAVLIGISYFVVKSVQFERTSKPQPDPNKPQQIEKFIQ
jgi:flagellar basal body-associated protein FliL